MRRSRVFLVLLFGSFLVALLAATPAFAYGPVAIQGKVVDATTGDPLPYATVTLFDMDPLEGHGLSDPIASTTTDEWGHYEFDVYLTYPDSWVFLWNKSCSAYIGRVGWSGENTVTKKVLDVYPPVIQDFGTTELTREPGVTPQSPIYGANRYDTALRISQAAYPLGLDGVAAHTTAGTVVIAAGESWPDALLAAGVAGVEGAPIILAGVYDPWGYRLYSPYWEYYDYDPMVEIRRLQPERAIIVGGEGVVPVQTEVNLKIWLGGDDVTRLWGDDRYGTARAVSEYVMENVSQPATLAVVATGNDFADVLAASAVIWRGELPVYMTSEEGIDQTSLDEMIAGGITDIMIVGGEAAVPADVEADLVAEFGADHVDRLGGANRYETSALVADWGVAEFGMDWSNVAFASGQKFADALTGGPLQGATGSPLLLARYGELPEAPAASLEAHAAEVEEVRFLGGPAVMFPQFVWEPARRIVDE